MAQWALPPDLHSKIEGGPLCFFHDHSIGSRDALIPRYTDSHACVRCVSALTEGRLSLDVHRIEKIHRRRFLEFWSFVEMGSADECWPWRGKFHSRCNSSYFPIPRHWNSGRQYSASRVACWFTWGDIGRLPMKMICGDNNCCNPLHMKIKGVPHFHHRRSLDTIDIEFSTRKLESETLCFLETTANKDPKTFERLEKTNKIWIDWRMGSNEPVNSMMVPKFMTENNS